MESIVFKTSISPGGDLLACLHTDSSITVWNLPSLRPYKKWGLTEQPNYNATNPESVKLRKLPQGLSEFHPIDVNWWSDHVRKFSFSTFQSLQSKFKFLFFFTSLRFIFVFSLVCHNRKILWFRFCLFDKRFAKSVGRQSRVFERSATDFGALSRPGIPQLRL